jgi:hypothetical protein
MRDKQGGYIGMVSGKEVEWLKNDLKNVEQSTPIVISTHIPLLSVAHQYRQGNTPVSSSTIIQNSKEVLDLFVDHNLKLVLQGHLHYRERIVIQGITFISVGAVCGKWWEGDYHGNQEGFGLIQIKNGNFTYQYIDYGWTPRGQIFP